MLMDGDLTVASREGDGTTFTLTLPLIEAAAEDIAPLLDSGPSTHSRGAQTNPRVLIAEDHDINQELMLSMAERAGFDADIAPDGDEAVRMTIQAVADGAPYRLILMDMQMPRIDGLEATRQLRARGYSAERLPIVALTANAYTEDVKACLAAGMQAHLSKPVRLRDLESVAAKWITRDGFHDAVPLASEPIATEESVRASLRERYQSRRDETVATMVALAGKEAVTAEEIAQMANMLHKVAGIAGHFAEETLGTIATELELQLLAANAADRVSVLVKGLDRLRGAM
jgi:CheY-like chemotaxis protein